MKINAKEMRKKVKIAKNDAYLKWLDKYTEKFESAANEGKDEVPFKFELDDVLKVEELEAYLIADGFSVKSMNKTAGERTYEILVSWLEDTSEKEN